MSFQELEQRIGHQFQQPELLRVALTHRSFHFENKATSPGHFERLEFLGDAVLDLLMSEALMNQYPDVDEGTLSKWRASLVNEHCLSGIARSLNLGQHVFLGRSESINRDQSQDRPRMLASVFEAVVAAIYQDGGLESVRKFVDREFQSHLSQLNPDNEFATDYKTRLQEYAQKRWKILPEYKLVGSDGPEHAKVFTFEVWIGEELYAQGAGNSRKAAEQAAAKGALIKLGVVE
jgi:ribonuclease-3